MILLLFSTISNIIIEYFSYIGACLKLRKQACSEEFIEFVQSIEFWLTENNVVRQ